MALVLANPVCGDATAPAFLGEHVLPLLAANNVPVLAVVTTTSADHAPALVAQHLDASAAPLTVVLASGDGTLHDIISALPPARPVHFVLVPCGTANALYASLFPPTTPADSDPHYRLQSVRAFIDRKPPTRLSLASTTLSAPGVGDKSVSVSAVVVSTSLHASILHDSEALRAEHPGIERFKIAAQQNSTKWYNARLTLTPAPAQPAVQIYDPAADAFVPHPDAPAANDTPLTLSGPFVYFLSTINVDRLEPAFRIAPLARAHPAPSTCDVVVIRPLRAPNVHADTPAARAAFAATTWAVLTAAYQDGAHVRLKYAVDGEGLPAPDAEGAFVVEYLRCGGWEWVPDADDEAAHFVCADGAVSSIPVHGSAVCAIDAFQHGYAVYA
ncbi:ATP-NAD kinase-like domain-containing protein [Pholiota molesta]|nr:ATP-NAD kinase-like domain-containing protein [Pholiota molesta]